jgi:hypothetical protein
MGKLLVAYLNKMPEYDKFRQSTKEKTYGLTFHMPRLPPAEENLGGKNQFPKDQTLLSSAMKTWTLVGVNSVKHDPFHSLAASRSVTAIAPQQQSIVIYGLFHVSRTTEYHRLIGSLLAHEMCFSSMICIAIYLHNFQSLSPSGTPIIPALRVTPCKL